MHVLAPFLLVDFDEQIAVRDAQVERRHHLPCRFVDRRDFRDLTFALTCEEAWRLDEEGE